MSTLKATQIYQRHLDLVSAAVWAGDDHKAAQYICFPITMTTVDGVAVMHDAEELIAGSAAFRKSLLRIGATEYHRICKTASMSDDGLEINGSHTTHVMSGGSYALPPYLTKMTLVWRDGLWLASQTTSQVANSDCTILASETEAALEPAQGTGQ